MQFFRIFCFIVQLGLFSMEREERSVRMKQKGLDDLVLPSSDFLLNSFSPASGLAASWQTLSASTVAG